MIEHLLTVARTVAHLTDGTTHLVMWSSGHWWVDGHRVT
jgi:hypothetical protein